MKKVLALILALTMIFALCACGSPAAPAASAPAADKPADAAPADAAAAPVSASLTMGTGGEAGT